MQCLGIQLADLEFSLIGFALDIWDRVQLKKKKKRPKDIGAEGMQA